MTRSKVFSKQEIKILVYNKVKLKGLTYEEAVKEVEQEIKSCIEVSRKKNKKKKPTFKEEFKKIKHGGKK